MILHERMTSREDFNATAHRWGTVNTMRPVPNETVPPLPLPTYEKLAASSPAERTELILQLIRDHPQGRLELPSSASRQAFLTEVRLGREYLKGRLEPDKDTPSWWNTELQGVNLKGADLRRTPRPRGPSPRRHVRRRSPRSRAARRRSPRGRPGANKPARGGPRGGRPAAGPPSARRIFRRRCSRTQLPGRFPAFREF